MLLKAAVEDYVTDPKSWMFNSPKKIELMQKTQLTNKQIRQYFHNHCSRFQGLSSASHGDNEEEEEDIGSSSNFCSFKNGCKPPVLDGDKVI